MKNVIRVLMLVFAFAVSGCSDKKAVELYDTAKFEELQNNREHAIELYEEIVKKYPETEYAKNAKERLSHINEASKNLSK